MLVARPSRLRASPRRWSGVKVMASTWDVVEESAMAMPVRIRNPMSPGTVRDSTNPSADSA